MSVVVSAATFVTLQQVLPAYGVSQPTGKGRVMQASSVHSASERLWVRTCRVEPDGNATILS